LIAFVTTADAQRARRFYGGTLGLPLVSEGPFALVFDVGGQMLRVAVAEEVVAAPHTVVGWAVQDAQATARDLARRGVVFERFGGMDQDELGIWRSPAGADVAWFRDPDGNVLSITAFAPE
jgi:catechol 2,3-dioxygenase-like lactoylglutathione lyase family enzyme